MARDPQPTSPIPAAERDAGFTLVEIVCVLAIVALLAAIVLPALPFGTSRARLESVAIDIAALLKADRDAAIRRQAAIYTRVDAPGRLVRSGSTGRVVQVPRDVGMDAALAAFCDRQSVRALIAFLPSGLSCGGTVTLSRLGAGYEVRVNWLTGGVDVVPRRML